MLPPPPPDPTGWRKWLSCGLDLLYPPACAVCQEILTHGRSLCSACAADLPQLVQPFCQSCGEMFQGEIDDHFTCPNCHRLKFAFEFARPATPRDERTLEMIHRLKYNRELHLAPELGRLAAGAFADPRLEVALREKWPLIPVPLHRRRFQHRHFNQAEEIARSLSCFIRLPLLPVLRRIRHTGHQTSLTRSQRLENLRGAFTVNSCGLRELPKISGAILIDDVLTTGSTVDECAKVLRRAGLRRLGVVTVMRG